MFDGRTDRREVSLRGNSKKLSRKDAIDKAKSERQERLESRRRAEAAVRVASVWRGSTQRGQLRKTAFLQLSAKHSDFLKAEAAIKQVFTAQGKPFAGIVPPHAALSPLLALGARAEPSAQNCPELLAWLACLLRRNLLEADQTGTSWAAVAVGGPVRHSALVCGFFRCCAVSLLRSAASAAAATGPPPSQGTASLQKELALTLQTWADVSSWRGVQQGLVAAGPAGALAAAACASLTRSSGLMALLQCEAQPAALVRSIVLVSTTATTCSAAALSAVPLWPSFACGVLGSRRVVGDDSLLALVEDTLVTAPTAAADSGATCSPSKWLLTLQACRDLLASAVPSPGTVQHPSTAPSSAPSTAQHRLFSLSPQSNFDILGAEHLNRCSMVILEAIMKLYTGTSAAAHTQASDPEVGQLVAGCVQLLLSRVPLHLSLRAPPSVAAAAAGGGTDLSATDDVLDSDSDSDVDVVLPAAGSGSALAPQQRLHPANAAAHDPAHALAFALATARGVPSLLVPPPEALAAGESGRATAAMLTSRPFVERLCSDVLLGAQPASPGVSSFGDSPAVQLGSCLWGVLQSALVAQILPGAERGGARQQGLLRSLGKHWTASRLAVGTASRFLAHVGAACGGNFVRLMWEQLCVGLPVGSASALATALQSPAKCEALALLCSVFAQKLMVIDDAELLEHQQVMTVGLLRRFVVTLNASLHLLAWVDDSAKTSALHSRPAHVLGLLTEGVLVYRRLHERQSRNPGQIASGAEWLWPRISASDLSAGTIIQLHQDSAEEAGAVAAGAAAGEGVSPPHLLAGQGGGSSTAATPALRAARALFVITQLPMVVPFKQRAELFHELLQADREDKQSGWGHGLKLRIRRDYLFEDSMSSFLGVVAERGRQSLRERMQITFISSDGREEPGIDGGGLFQEWLLEATQRGFDPQYGLFRVTPNQELYPSAASGDFAADHLRQFEFLGRLLAKAVYEGMLVEPVFAGFFLNKLLGRPNLVDDLVSLDPALHSNLLSIKQLPAETVGDLGLAFETTVERMEGSESRPVVPGGSDIAVTGSNVGQYITHVAHFRLNSLIAPQTRAFLAGFRDIIPVDWLRMFSAPELQLLIGGSPKDVDVADMRANTVYAGGYHDQHPVVAAFWEVLEHDFNHEDRAAFLMFVTSCSRPPLLGFRTLNPKLAIHRVPLHSEGDAAKLPTSATCMNLLKLPEYPHKSLLLDKLKYAIHSASGFELS